MLNLTGVMRWITERLTPPKGVSPRSQPVCAAHRDGEDPATKNRRLPGRAESFLDRALGGLGLYQTLRPLVVGLVHGLAGSAAVALLVLSTIKSPLWSTAYLLVFGFGTMLGMMLMTAAISMPVVYTGRKIFQDQPSFDGRFPAAPAWLSGFSLCTTSVLWTGYSRSQAHWIPQ